MANKLLIAIPALNEEESIESIILRSLAARDHIRANSTIRDIDITVVSDGSTDRTAEIAKRYEDQINLIVFPKNRGYGAAIKEAWRRSDADLLGFLDADGTCEPEFFATLCSTAVTHNADVVLGCRLNKNSQMPLIRRIGNLIFAAILSAFSSTCVRDTASGMRVVKRSSLPDLYPLPDGLHFTPAMSARAMLSSHITIREVDMPYSERAGESKLHVIKDGIRFLKVILEAAFLYRPSRPLGLLAVAMAAIAASLMASPILYYLRTSSVAEWMIYRFLVSEVLAVGACLLFCASHLTGRIVSIALSEGPGSPSRPSRILFGSRWFWTVPGGLFLIGGALVVGSLLQLITTGETYEHWSRYVAMSCCLLIATILTVTSVVDYVLSLVANRLEYLKSPEDTPGA